MSERGVKLFMIISDSIINKPIFHFITYSSAKRFGCLLYMCTFKIRATPKEIRFEIEDKLQVMYSFLLIVELSY